MNKIKLSKSLAVLLTLAMMFSIMALAPLGASAADEELWVNGNDILKDEDKTVKCGNGEAIYSMEDSKHTLTLTNATIDIRASIYKAGIYASNIDVLYLQVNGTNSITSNGTESQSGIVHGIFTKGSLNINGTGSLTITAGISDSLSATSGIFVGDHQNPDNMDLTIKDATVTLNNILPEGTQSYGIQADGTQSCSFINAKVSVNDFYYGIFSSRESIAFDNSNIIVENAGEGVTSRNDVNLDGTAIIKNTSDVTIKSTYSSIASNKPLIVDNSTLNLTSSAENYNGIYCADKVSIINNATVNATSGYPTLYSKKALTIESSTVKSVSEHDVGIYTLSTLTISGNSNVDATGKWAGLRSDGNMTISDGTIKSTSKNDIGLLTLGTLNITGGKVIATGGNNNAAIGARYLKTNEDNPPTQITLGNALSEKNGGKIAVSNWFDVSNGTRSWTSFISSDKEELTVINGLPSNALNSVEITVPTPPSPPLAPSYNYYTIEVVNTENGTISPATTSVMEGGNKTYTITPNEGYVIKDVLVDGVSIGAVDTYTFQFISKAHKITATFGKKDEKPDIVLPPATKEDNSFAFAKTLKTKKASVGDTLTARVTAGKQTFEKDEVIIVNEKMKVTVKATGCTAKLGKFSKTSGTPVIMKFTKPGTARVTVTIHYNGEVYTKVLTVKVSK